jgi:menaquinone-specific isochorismate synthase
VAHAGAGIVAASDPESEMLETRVKFRPIVDALA